MESCSQIPSTCTCSATNKASIRPRRTFLCSSTKMLQCVVCSFSTNIMGHHGHPGLRLKVLLGEKSLFSHPICSRRNTVGANWSDVFRRLANHHSGSWAQHKVHTDSQIICMSCGMFRQVKTLECLIWSQTAFVLLPCPSQMQNGLLRKICLEFDRRKTIIRFGHQTNLAGTVVAVHWPLTEGHCLD
jgi:hypothetical protein